MTKFAEPLILARHNNIFIYKLCNNNNDIRHMTLFLNKQSDNHLSTWGSRYSYKECVKRLELCDKGNILLCLLIEYINNNYNIIGLVGYNYNKLFNTIITNNECYLSHIIIDELEINKGYGTIGLQLLLNYVKSKTTINNIYAEIYNNNISSIKLHIKLGYKIINDSNIKVLEYKLNRN